VNTLKKESDRGLASFPFLMSQLVNEDKNEPHPGGSRGGGRKGSEKGHLKGGKKKKKPLCPDRLQRGKIITCRKGIRGLR